MWHFWINTIHELFISLKNNPLRLTHLLNKKSVPKVRKFHIMQEDELLKLIFAFTLIVKVNI